MIPRCRLEQFDQSHAALLFSPQTSHTPTAATIGSHTTHDAPLSAPAPAPAQAVPAISISPANPGLERPQPPTCNSPDHKTTTSTRCGSSMESIIPDDSPLAQYLEGQGRGDSRPPSPDASTFADADTQGFAPRGPSTLQSRIRDKLPQPLRIHARNGSIARIHTACSKAVNSRIGRADNERFLERFRYLIVASQLLGEQGGLRASAIPTFAIDGHAGPHDFRVATISPTGAALTGATAFALVWLVHWSRRQPTFSRSRTLFVLLVFAAAATAVYGYMRRQWLQYLRQEAVAGASALVANLQAFEASTSSALALIQEVELVSRGYRLSSPLPPISRIEERGQARRCQRLRRSLRAAYADVIPVLSQQCHILKPLIQEDDLEKYLDVYEISNPDLQEAALGYSASEFDDAETLKALRTFQYRLSTLRRVYLCSLLAMEADGGKPDFPRWSTVVDSMLNTASPVGQWSEKFNRVLAEEEQFVLPSPAKVAPTPGREKIRNSVRKLSGLSSGIRGLQAKMQVLREETNKSLEDTEDVSELGHSLLAQYDSIGADLKSLVQAWEAGKNALALNIDRQERRISQASSGLRSPVPSLGGLTAVDEGSPSDALRALNGDLLSPQQSAPSSDQGSASDDEVFEAIAIPKTRATMSREERMQKIQDDRIRQASLREQRDSNTNMLRELESVINMRPHRLSAPPRGRVTSL
ncbi:proliferating cell nuclear antigen pcna [Stemphylium lycopersici]|uniref:Vezatin n=1 Tax=Stemphylium lycopersici TaxID=183478 RepID=A0A364NES0_STELY|nr:proliferating cell nuclear antigen pcna [Stemphylium lycopersici]RAR06526.1 proliferating cell nuclear antigen pcna [Stemphylium lycopersici]RAR15808.1 proliferating cell nuclear antigen pcna [Stemphylium lycopersici]